MIRSCDCAKCIGMNEIRLIDADAYRESLAKELAGTGCYAEDYQNAIENAIYMLDEAPTINAEPVRQGRWTMNSNRPDTIICTVCDSGFDVWKHEAKDFRYCPACGVRMGEEDSHG